MQENESLQRQVDSLNGQLQDMTVSATHFRKERDMLLANQTDLLTDRDTALAQVAELRNIVGSLKTSLNGLYVFAGSNGCALDHPVMALARADAGVIE